MLLVTAGLVWKSNRLGEMSVTAQCIGCFIYLTYFRGLSQKCNTESAWLVLNSLLNTADHLCMCHLLPSCHTRNISWGENNIFPRRSTLTKIVEQNRNGTGFTSISYWTFPQCYFWKVVAAETKLLKWSFAHGYAWEESVAIWKDKRGETRTINTHTAKETFNWFQKKKK